MLAAKKKRLIAWMLGFEGTDPIFANKHLCLENKIPVGNSMKTKRAKGSKFAWDTGGKILMRKADKPKAVHVVCEADLKRITSN